MTTRVVTAHVPAELAKQLDNLAGQLDWPRGWLVKEAIEAYVNLAEERRNAMDEAFFNSVSPVLCFTCAVGSPMAHFV